MIEIRFHGRGGQGALTAARILASAFWKEKKYSLVLPEFKSERRSAPIAVSVRVSDEPVKLRSKIYKPDYIVVLDPSLISLKQVKVLDGFKKESGLVIISANKESQHLQQLHDCKVGMADADATSRKYGLGNPALPATGTAILGALAKITGLISLESIISAIEESDELPKKENNVLAAKDVFNEARIIDPVSGQVPEGKNNLSTRPVLSGWQELPPSVVSLGDTRNNLTGSWRKIRPYYEDKMSPCKNACPLENEIPHWLSLLEQGKEREAWEKLIEKNPLPAVTGRVCQAFCEGSCNRKEFDESISIRDLEKYLGDKALAENWRFSVPDNGKKKLHVAVVGSGPCGLSCAYQLARQGYRVSIFEELPVLGGMLRVGIPEFRLPKDILDREINNILRFGIMPYAICPVDSGIFDCDAIFFATGLQKSRKLNIPGEENNPNVLYGLDFLKSVNLGKQVSLGKEVMVVGGGNTAIDAARTAKRMGSNVRIFYRRAKTEMPAIESEVSEAEKEGIEIIEQILPVGICWKVIEFQKTKPGELDETGRRKFIPVEGSYSCGEFDNLIIAAGEEKVEIPDITKGGKVFAAQDTGNVPAAINAGRLGAQVIDYYLRTGQRNITQNGSKPKIVGFKDINTAYFRHHKKSRMPRLEAKRCFSCGVCDLCGNCWKFCPHMTVFEKDGELEIDYDFCKGCGICAQECPRAVISQELEG